MEDKIMSEKELFQDQGITGENGTIPVGLNPEEVNTDEAIEASLESAQNDAAAMELNAIENETNTEITNEIHELLVKGENLDDMSYIELKALINQVKKSLNDLKTAESLITTFHSMSGTEQDPLSVKIEVASAIKNKDTGLDADFTKFEKQLPELQLALVELEEKVTAKIAERYSDKTATVSFLTEEMCNTLTRTLNDISANPGDDMVAANERYRYVLFKRDLYRRRFANVFFFLKYIAMRNTTELRKTLQYISNMYEKNFKEVKESLARIYPAPQLAAFETALQKKCGWTKMDTVTLFSFIYRIMSKPAHTTIEYGRGVIVNIMIMNINDIYAGLWDNENGQLNADGEDIFGMMKYVLAFLHRDFASVEEYVYAHGYNRCDWEAMYASVSLDYNKVDLEPLVNPSNLI